MIVYYISISSTKAPSSLFLTSRRIFPKHLFVHSTDYFKLRSLSLSMRVSEICVFFFIMKFHEILKGPTKAHPIIY